MLPLSCTSLLNFNFTDPVLLITGSVFSTHPRTWPTVSVQKRLFNQGGSSVSSVAQWYLIPCDPMNCSTPGFPVHHQLPGLLKLMSMESVMPMNHLILCHPLLKQMLMTSFHGTLHLPRLSELGQLLPLFPQPPRVPSTPHRLQLYPLHA